MVPLSAIYHLFPILQKSHDLIFIYSTEIRDTDNSQLSGVAKIV